MQELNPIMAQALAAWKPRPHTQLTPAQQWHQRNDAAALKQQIKEQQCNPS